MPLQVIMPECPHRHGNHCRYLSDALGRFVTTNRLICGKLCPEHPGPTGGREISKHQRGEFLAWAIRHFYLHISEKVLRNYSRDMQVGIPEPWPRIKRELAWLDEIEWVTGLCCTGSLCIKDKTNHKDYDLVIRVRDLDTAYEQRHALQERLPRTIDGKRVDYFFSHTTHCQFFAVLDPDAKRFYASRWFGANATMHDGIEWVPVESDEIDAAIRRMIDKPKQIKQTPKPTTVQQAINVTRRAGHAAKSISKTTLGIDRASDRQVEARLAVCRQCPGNHAVFRKGELHTCGPMLDSMRDAGQRTCGCILSKKARDLAEDCPFGWWPKSLYRPG